MLKPIVSVDPDGNVEQFDDIWIAKASLDISISVLNRVLSGRQKAANGRAWFYASDARLLNADLLAEIVISLRPKGDERHRRKWRKVVCDQTGEVFESAVEAAARYGCDPDSVRRCCRGEVQHAGRMRWRFLYPHKDDVRIPFADRRHSHEPDARGSGAFAEPEPFHVVVRTAGPDPTETAASRLAGCAAAPISHTGGFDSSQLQESSSARRKLHPRQQEVVSIESDGKVVRYGSIGEAARSVGHFERRGAISDLLNKKTGVTAFGLRWMRASDYDAGMPLPDLSGSLRREVVVRDPDGITRCYPSVAEAARQIGLSRSAISDLLERSKSACRDGFVFHYAHDPRGAPERDIPLRGRGRNRQVVCVETGTIFQSLALAAGHIGKSPQAIRNVCEGRRKTCGGLRWAFKD